MDVRDSMGVQVGEGNTQIIYAYRSRLTVDTGITRPPLVSVSGKIDSPYRGLNAFDERDAPFFFGRERAAAEVLERMSGHARRVGLFIVSGVSGAGKSSLLRAGVIPRIRGEGLAADPGAAAWPCLVLTPTRAPLDELAFHVAMLAGTDAATVRGWAASDPAAFALAVRQGARGRRLLLVIDQFEQVFTQCTDGAERAAFIAALHAAATTGQGEEQVPAALVVLSVRADFEARCADYPELARAVQDRYLVTAMTGRQLRLAITSPARQADGEIDDDLADQLLEEVRTRRSGASGAGVLPLLSHALDQAWRSRAGANLTLADYERTGGIERAVADSAQRAYDRLTPGQRAAARRVFIQLTAAGADNVDTAQRAARTELTRGNDPESVGDTAVVLEMFAAERLLILSAESVEISHEVLLTAWPLLRDTWLAESRASRLARARLRDVAAEWARNPWDSSYLYSGTLLQAASEVAAQGIADPARNPPLNQAERDFLRASQAAHHRNRLQRRGIKAALAVLLIIAVATAVIAVVRSGQLATENRIVSKQRDEAVGARVASLASTLRVTDPVTAKRLAIVADRLAPASLDTRSALATLYNQVEDFTYQPPGTNEFQSVTADGTYHVVSYASAHKVRLVDVDARKVIRDLNVPGAAIRRTALSGNDRYLSLYQADGSVSVWDTRTGRRLPARFHQTGLFTGLNGTGSFLLIDDYTKFTLRDTTSGRPVLVIPHRLDLLTFSGDSKYLIGARGPNLEFWDIRTGRLVPHPAYNLGTGNIDDLAASDDGKLLAIRKGQTLYIMHLGKSGDPVIRYIPQAHPGGSLDFSSEGQYIDLGSTVWMTGGNSAQPVFTYPNPTSCGDSTFGPGDNTLRCISQDNAVIELSLHSALDLITFDNTFSPAAAFSTDGSTLAIETSRALEIWDPARRVKRGALPISLNARDSRYSLSRNGRLLANIRDSGDIEIWDVPTATKKATLRTHLQISIDTSVAFSPDGQTLATLTFRADGSSVLGLWDTATGRLRVTSTKAHPGFPLFGGLWNPKVLFSPNGRTVISAADQGIIDTATGARLAAPTAGLLAPLAISRDGLIVAYEGNGKLTFWDSRTLQQQFYIPVDAQLSDIMAFSPDGKLLAAVDASGQLRLWDVADRHPFGPPLTGDADGFPVEALSFSADGSAVLNIGSDGRLRTHLIEPTKISAEFCAQVGPLSRADWHAYIPDLPYRRTC